MFSGFGSKNEKLNKMSKTYSTCRMCMAVKCLASMIFLCFQVSPMNNLVFSGAPHCRMHTSCPCRDSSRVLIAACTYSIFMTLCALLPDLKLTVEQITKASFTLKKVRQKLHMFFFYEVYGKKKFKKKKTLYVLCFFPC